MKKYFVIIAALAMTVSCTEKMSEELNYSSEQMTQEVTVKVAPFIGQDTKSTIDTSANFAWASGDKFGVYPLKTSIGAEQTSQQVMFQIHESSVGTNKGLFTGTGWGLVTGGSYKYFAYYPYDSKATYDNVNVKYDTLFTQASNVSSAHIKNDYMATPSMAPVNPKDALFTFYHIGSLVNFRLLVPPLDRNKKFIKVEIYCNTDDVFATAGSYDPTEMSVSVDPAVVTYPEFTATAFAKKLTLNLNNNQPDENGYLNCYFMLPPTELAGKTLNVLLRDSNGEEYTGSREMAGNIESGKKYSPAFINITKTSSGEVTDLSENEKANCYIINKVGRYKFYCGVKGNGYDPDDDVAHNENAAINGAVDAIISWETTNTITAPSVGTIIRNVSIDEVNKYVFFETPETFTNGNALISVKDEDGNILWSWHIWATTDTFSSVLLDEIEIMDRNIGALSATIDDPKAKGCLYQWGRSFPHAGFASDTTISPGTIPLSLRLAATTNNLNWEILRVDETSTLENSARYPMRFYLTHYNSTKDWCYSEHSGKRWLRDVKTMYDPSPEGWMVRKPSYDYYFSQEIESNKSTCLTTSPKKGGCIYEKDSRVIYFPYSGTIRWSSSATTNILVYNNYGQGVYWTSYAWWSGLNAAYCNMYINGYQSYVADRAEMCAVRCMKDPNYSNE